MSKDEALIGQTLSHYRIIKKLGAGGMGVVYLARDSRLDRFVAIKALPEQLADDPDRLARFEREAKVIASLNNPGIAAVYALEEHDGKKYLVMEYVEGTLATKLRRGRLPVDESIDIAIHIAEVLEAAHEKGVIHRDLKPGNIMITPEGSLQRHPLISNHFGDSVSGPEKAGVGGSIPSLATTPFGN